MLRSGGEDLGEGIGGAELGVGIRLRVSMIDPGDFSEVVRCCSEPEGES